MFEFLGEAAGLVTGGAGAVAGIVGTAVWKARKIKRVYDESLEAWDSLNAMSSVAVDASDDVRVQWNKTRKELEDVRDAFRDLF